MAFPLTAHITSQLVRMILGWECAGGLQQLDGFENELQFKSSFQAAFQILLEAFGIMNAIHDCFVFG